MFDRGYVVSTKSFEEAQEVISRALLNGFIEYQYPVQKPSVFHPCGVTWQSVFHWGVSSCGLTVATLPLMGNHLLTLDEFRQLLPYRDEPRDTLNGTYVLCSSLEQVREVCEAGYSVGVQDTKGFTKGVLPQGIPHFFGLSPECEFEIVNEIGDGRLVSIRRFKEICENILAVSKENERQPIISYGSALGRYLMTPPKKDLLRESLMTDDWL